MGIRGKSSSALHTTRPLRRGDPRVEAAHAEIHGIATRNQGRDQGPFVVWDISSTGLRLWVPDHMGSGEHVRLTIAKPFIVMLSVDVVWCKAANDGSGYYIGVRVLDNFSRLEALSRNIADTRADSVFESIE